ncbi:MAG: DUF3606 domain-containing protein [Pedobacter sp.]|nr:MAG: DUF3606 domain-containing protein [Pedobacter sp.]
MKVKINANDPNEVSSLATELGVTIMDIREAIFFIGTALSDIRFYVKRHHLMLGS